MTYRFSNHEEYIVVVLVLLVVVDFDHKIDVFDSVSIIGIDGVIDIRRAYSSSLLQTFGRRPPWVSRVPVVRSAPPRRG